VTLSEDKKQGVVYNNLRMQKVFMDDHTFGTSAMPKASDVFLMWKGNPRAHRIYEIASVLSDVELEAVVTDNTGFTSFAELVQAGATGWRPTIRPGTFKHTGALILAFNSAQNKSTAYTGGN
jgi:hypothetical protein